MLKTKHLGQELLQGAAPGKGQVLLWHSNTHLGGPNAPTWALEALASSWVMQNRGAVQTPAQPQGPFGVYAGHPTSPSPPGPGFGVTQSLAAAAAACTLFTFHACYLFQEIIKAAHAGSEFGFKEMKKKKKELANAACLQILFRAPVSLNPAEDVSHGARGFGVVCRVLGRAR